MMGVVASQSLKNVISTYFGFIIGAINTLFLYTKFMTDEYYGMVSYMLSAGFVMMPLMAFGVHNTLVKFYSSFKTKLSINSFLTFMLYLPLLMIIPITIIGYFAHEAIGEFLSTRNAMIKHYLVHTLVVAIALAYFEVFFAWVKVHLQTAFGNLMKEVFHRIGAMLMLFMLYLDVVTLNGFMIGLVLVYVIRMLVMMGYAFSVKFPKLVFKRFTGWQDVLKYSLLIIVAGSVVTIFLDVDKLMLGNYVDIEEVAYYNVAIFITAVIAVPMRSMHQIVYPLCAQYLNHKDYDKLGDLYKRSSINLFVIGGGIFLLIILNINQLYLLLPEDYSVGVYVVLIISVSKLSDAVIGSNNAILFNSDYYRVVLFLGVVLVIIMVLLNIIFIPRLGIYGAAFATLIAIILYNAGKLFFVYKAFKMLPFTVKTLKGALLLVVMSLSFYFWDFSFHPLINIVIKSLLISIIYCSLAYRFNLSEDINALVGEIVNKVFK